MSKGANPLLKVELGGSTMTVPAPREDINVTKTVATISGTAVGGQTRTVETGVKSYALLSSEERALWAHRCATSWSMLRWSSCCIFFVTLITMVILQVLVFCEEDENESPCTLQIWAISAGGFLLCCVIPTFCFGKCHRGTGYWMPGFCPIPSVRVVTTCPRGSGKLYDIHGQVVDQAEVGMAWTYHTSVDAYLVQIYTNFYSGCCQQWTQSCELQARTYEFRELDAFPWYSMYSIVLHLNRILSNVLTMYLNRTVAWVAFS